MFGPEYDALYFTDPVWVTGHSVFHAPLMIALWVAYWVVFRLSARSNMGEVGVLVCRRQRATLSV